MGKVRRRTRRDRKPTSVLVGKVEGSRRVSGDVHRRNTSATFPSLHLVCLVACAFALALFLGRADLRSWKMKEKQVERMEARGSSTRTDSPGTSSPAKAPETNARAGVPYTTETDQINKTLTPSKYSDEDNRRVETMDDGQQYVVLQTIPHDPDAFTQGLTFSNGKLFEGTGLNGKSEVRQLDTSEGRVLRSVSLAPKFFGEGLAHYGLDGLLQLTWKSQVGFLYNATTLELRKEFRYETHTGEGWGVTYDPINRVFMVSDGSHWLHFWDEQTLEETRRISVHLGDGRVVRFLNELEFVNGRVLANIWYRDQIVSINPETGIVENIYDFRKLWPQRTADADCFNGISVTGAEGELFVTGKLWPYMFRVKLLGRRASAVD